MIETTDNTGQSFRNVLVSLAAFTIIIAGMSSARDFIVPILLAAFIAIICSPALFWLESKKVPRVLAFIIVIAFIVALLIGVGAVVGASINDFTNNLPEYKTKINESIQKGLKFAEDNNFPISKNQIMQNLDLGMFFGYAQDMLSQIGGILSKTFLIFVIVAFILFETSSFPKKLEMIHLAEGDNDQSGNVFTGKIKRYLAIKTITSLVTAIIVGVGLDITGVDYPYLWGMLAFFLNFIPSIGSILAAIPVVLLTMIQFGPWTTLWVALGYSVVNVGIGNFIEPRFMGKELGLSPLVVFLSLIFWGWVLGPVGMFLSVPLTMTAKIAFDSRKDTKWIGVLLGP